MVIGNASASNSCSAIAFGSVALVFASSGAPIVICNARAERMRVFSKRVNCITNHHAVSITCRRISQIVMVKDISVYLSQKIA